MKYKLINKMFFFLQTVIQNKRRFVKSTIECWRNQRKRPESRTVANQLRSEPFVGFFKYFNEKNKKIQINKSKSLTRRTTGGTLEVITTAFKPVADDVIFSRRFTILKNDLFKNSDTCDNGFFTLVKRRAVKTFRRF